MKKISAHFVSLPLHCWPVRSLGRRRRRTPLLLSRYLLSTNSLVADLRLAKIQLMISFIFFTVIQ